MREKKRFFAKNRFFHALKIRAPGNLGRQNICFRRFPRVRFEHLAFILRYIQSENLIGNVYVYVITN